MQLPCLVTHGCAVSTCMQSLKYRLYEGTQIRGNAGRQEVCSSEAPVLRASKQSSRCTRATCAASASQHVQPELLCAALPVVWPCT